MSVLAWLRLPRGELPDAAIAAGELKIAPLTNTVPEEATALMRQAYPLLPHIKITDLLLEVDRWTGFSRHFTHLKTGQPCEDPTLLLTAILADAINLGIAKMAEACPGTTARKLDWIASLYVRDETYANMQLGRRSEVWHGWGWTPAKRARFAGRQTEIREAANRQLAGFRVFVANVETSGRVLERLEAAIMNQLYHEASPLPVNPTAPMRGPKYVVKRGKTPV